MQRHGLGAILVEPGASLDYFTGVRWSRAERLTAALIPATAIRSSSRPSSRSRRSPKASPSRPKSAPGRSMRSRSKLVADWLRERGLTDAPVGIEETNRFFIVDRLKAQLPELRDRQRQSGRSRLPDDQVAGRTRADAGGGRHHHRRDPRHPCRRSSEGMTPTDIGDMLEAAMVALRRDQPVGAGPARRGVGLSARHRASRRRSRRGEVVLLDCGCDGARLPVRHFAQLRVRRRPDAPSSARCGSRCAQRPGNRHGRGQASARPPEASTTRSARAYESWGYGPGYKLPGTSHRTGHGIGMEGHEPVNLVHGETTPLAPGMCFSNEPGIYLPGKFGIRLEDCFHMTAAGPQMVQRPAASRSTEPFGPGRLTSGRAGRDASGDRTGRDNGPRKRRAASACNGRC